MPLTLYGTMVSGPYRVALITAEAIGLSVESKNIDLRKGEHLTPEFLKINPQHTIPTLDDNGDIIVDSHAIIAYLVSKYGKDDSLYPKDLVKRALVDSRLHFDSGVAFSIQKITFKAHIVDGQTEPVTAWQTQKILDVYELVNTFLERTKWIAGDTITIADIALVTTISSLDAMLAIDDGKYPNIRKWLDAANALPYFSVNKIGIEKFRESWKAVSTH